MNEKKPHNTWHIAFYDAIRLELLDYRDVLDFDIEHQLTREPLRIDTVVIKKKDDVIIDKHIAAIFKKWNVIEYKSPEDSLSIADFHKGMAYAHLYCTPPERGTMDDLTVSFVISREPRELKNYLREVCHYTLTESWPGITVVAGGMMAIQIIERKKLSADESFWLAMLCRGLSYESRQAVIAKVETVPEGAPVDAYMYILIQANGPMAKELGMTGEVIMEQELMRRGVVAKWESRGEVRGEAKGEARGEAKGKRETAKNLKQLGVPDEKLALATGFSLEEIAKL
jgi:hypothetical protein